MAGASTESKLSVLIVDDESSLRDALALNLGHVGYEVKAVGSATRALEVL